MYISITFIFIAMTLMNMQSILSEFSLSCWRRLDQKNLEVINVSCYGLNSKLFEI